MMHSSKQPRCAKIEYQSSIAAKKQTKLFTAVINLNECLAAYKYKFIKYTPRGEGVFAEAGHHNHLSRNNI